ncbi:putative transcription factor C2H2 family [Lupinus albus]|uniref:Putative transcription factor C2H2 family n=1 Tax=Lupinus albus TaxID=3870 RepID=A0A6A4MM38_LUPAL|nr:putative transcription factor C2H2 family [Lupinus albus]
MNTISQAFAPEVVRDPSLTFSYFISNASNVILILFLSLCMATIISTIIVLLLLKIFEYISDTLLDTLEDDIEEGRMRSLVVRSSLAYQTTTLNNRERLQTYIQESEMVPVYKFPSHKLPPLVIYGQNDELSSFCSDCVICLENFMTGESCQIFPLCNHLFHSYCIEHWLEENFTCPVCRNCLLDTTHNKLQSI